MKNETMLYEELVRSMYDSGLHEMVSNGKPEHAIVLFKLFFEQAKSRVAIFCRDLNASVFGDDRILNAAKEAVTRGVSVQVITQSDNPEPTNFREWLETTAKTNNQIFIRHCDSGNRFEKLEANFAIMDERAFRLESDRTKIAAFAWLNNPKDAAQFGRIFDSIRVALA